MRKSSLRMAVLVAAMIVMLVLPRAGGTLVTNAQEPALDKELNVYNWADYIDEDVLKEYEATYHVKINYDNFASNEELLTKLQAGASGYDVIFPSDYMVAQMIDLKLLAKIDKKALPNLANIDPYNLNPWYDPDNQYCVPYMWGVTGIGYLASLEKAPTGWGALFDPEQARYYSEHGGINILDDEREVFSALLKYLGYSVNDTDPKHLAQARDTIVKVLPLFHSFNSTDYQTTLLIPKEVSISHAWIGDVMKANMSTATKDNPNGDWKFIVPKEGAIRFQDNMCITATSKRLATAEHFINFLMDAKNAARISNTTGYPSANKAAREFIKPEILNVIPPAEVLEKLEWIRPLDDDTSKLYDQTWTEIRATQ